MTSPTRWRPWAQRAVQSLRLKKLDEDQAVLEDIENEVDEVVGEMVRLHDHVFKTMAAAPVDAKTFLT